MSTTKPADLTPQQRSILAAMQSLPDRTAVRRISQALQTEITTQDMRPLEALHLVKMVEVEEAPIIRYSLTPGGDKLATEIRKSRQPPIHTPEMAKAIPTNSLPERVTKAMLAKALADGRSLPWMSAKFDATTAGLRQLMSEYGLSTDPAANQPEPKGEEDEMPRGIPAANRPSHEDLLRMVEEYKAAGRPQKTLAADLHIKPNTLSNWISMALNTRLKPVRAAVTNVAAGSGGAAPITLILKLPAPAEDAPPETSDMCDGCAVTPRTEANCLAHDIGCNFEPLPLKAAEPAPGLCPECHGTGELPNAWDDAIDFCDCPAGERAAEAAAAPPIPAHIAQPVALQALAEEDCTPAQAEAPNEPVARAKGNGEIANWENALAEAFQKIAELEQQNNELKEDRAKLEQHFHSLSKACSKHQDQNVDLCCEIESLKSQNAYLRDQTTEPLLLCQVDDALRPVLQVGLLPQVGDHYPEPTEIDGRTRFIIWECVAAGMIGQRPVRVLRMVLDTTDAGKVVA